MRFDFEVIYFGKYFNIKKDRIICRRSSLRNSGSQDALQQAREEGLYELHSGSAAGEGLRDEDGDYGTGERGGHTC